MFMFYQSYPCVKRSTISNLDTSGKKIEAILTTERNVISTISFSPCWTSYNLECNGRRHINCNKEKTWLNQLWFLTGTRKKIDCFTWQDISHLMVSGGLSCWQFITIKICKSLIKWDLSKNIRISCLYFYYAVASKS